MTAIIANAPRKWQLALRVLEQTGMRTGELGKLEWADVDLAGSRFRIRNGKTNAARRWVAVPEWLMEEIAVICPPDDRTPERRLFVGATRRNGDAARRPGGWTRPLQPARSTASLRERQDPRGVPVTELAAQLGHARKSMTLDTYSHVLLEDA